jgi:hypothetical protein
VVYASWVNHSICRCLADAGVHVLATCTRQVHANQTSPAADQSSLSPPACAAHTGKATKPSKAPTTHGEVVLNAAYVAGCPVVQTRMHTCNPLLPGSGPQPCLIEHHIPVCVCWGQSIGSILRQRVPQCYLEVDLEHRLKVRVPPVCPHPGRTLPICSTGALQHGRDVVRADLQEGSGQVRGPSREVYWKTTTTGQLKVLKLLKGGAWAIFTIISYQIPGQQVQYVGVRGQPTSQADQGSYQHRWVHAVAGWFTCDITPHATSLTEKYRRMR